MNKMLYLAMHLNRTPIILSEPVPERRVSEDFVQSPSGPNSKILSGKQKHHSKIWTFCPEKQEHLKRTPKKIPKNLKCVFCCEIAILKT